MKFKIGDIIVVYQGYRYIAEVTKAYGDMLEVIARKDGELLMEDSVHVRQCRRLKKREPRRRVWIPKPDFVQSCDFTGSAWRKKPTQPELYIEFIEVRKTKKST